MAASKRDQLIDMAMELFFKNGCHTVGIDRLLAEASVAKMTLYSHFKSKEALILAAAERLHEQVLEQFLAILEDQNLSPIDRLHAVFDRLEDFTTAQGFPGCPFVNLSVEFPDPSHPIHQVSIRHKHKVEEHLEESLRGLGVREPESVARQLNLIYEGAKVMIQITGDSSYVQSSRQASELLLEKALAEA